MFFKLVALAVILQISAEREFQDKSVSETFVVESEKGTTNVRGEKYVKVFDPELNKYAYKRITLDNGKVHREAGFLDDDEGSAPLQTHGPTFRFFSRVTQGFHNLLKNVFSWEI